MFRGMVDAVWRVIGRVVGYSVGSLVGWAAAAAIRRAQHRHPGASDDELLADIFGDDVVRQHRTREAARKLDS